jgi:hypothetical protein
VVRFSLILLLVVVLQLHASDYVFSFKCFWCFMCACDFAPLVLLRLWFVPSVFYTSRLVVQNNTQP